MAEGRGFGTKDPIEGDKIVRSDIIQKLVKLLVKRTYNLKAQVKNVGGI